MKHLLKGFKKVSEDDKSTTFEHKNGHRIQIAHSGVDKNMRGHLKELNLYDGGTVPNKKKPQPMPIDPDKAKEVQESFKKALGFADGGQVGEEFTLDLEPKKFQQPLYMRPEIQQGAEQQRQLEQIPEMFRPISEQPAEAEPMPENMPIQAPTQPQQANVPKPSMQPMRQMDQGLRMEAGAIGQQGKQEALAAQEHQNELMQLENGYKERRAALDQERIAATNDIRNGHVDPQHYVHSKSGFGQAMTAIGVILGGIGAGLTGGNNQALEFLNKQIDRDIEGQKAELGKKENLLSHLHQEYGNIQDATIMAKAMQADMYSAKMMQIASASKDPQVQARAMQNAAMLHMKYEAPINQVAARQALMSSNVSPAAKIQALPKEHQLKAFEELGKVEQAEQSKKLLNDTMEEAYKVNSVSNRITSPLQSKSQLDGMEVKLLKVLKPIFNNLSESDKVQAMANLPKVTDNRETADRKKAYLLSLIESDRSTPILDSYGIKPPQQKFYSKNPNAR